MLVPKALFVVDPKALAFVVAVLPNAGAGALPNAGAFVVDAVPKAFGVAVAVVLAPNAKPEVVGLAAAAPNAGGAFVEAAIPKALVVAFDAVPNTGAAVLLLAASNMDAAVVVLLPPNAGVDALLPKAFVVVAAAPKAGAGAEVVLAAVAPKTG